MLEKILKVKKLSETARLPKRATDGSAGFDLFSSLDSPVELCPGEAKFIPCGIALQIMENYVGLMFVRSGIASKFGISLANAVGVIDSDYRGEICAALKNFGDKPYIINNGDRIAQIVILKHEAPKLELCADLDETSRNKGGFGSTGK